MQMLHGSPTLSGRIQARSGLSHQENVGTETLRDLIAADTGGTFTDIVVHDRQTNRTEFGKTLTNYADLLSGIVDGLSDTSASLTEAAITAAFEATYRTRFGHLNEGAAIEFIGLRVGALVPTPHPDLAEVAGALPTADPAPRTTRPVYFATIGSRLETPVFRRVDLPHGFTWPGSLVIKKYSVTTVVAPGQTVSVGALGELLIVATATDAVP